MQLQSGMQNFHFFQWKHLHFKLELKVWVSTFSMKTFFFKKVDFSKAVQNRVRQEVFEQLQVDKRYAGL